MTSKKLDLELAVLGGEVMKAQFTRQRLAKELDAEAAAWQAKADAQTVAVSEHKSYLVGKARECRQRAAEIRKAIW
jgi:hypothetical protein